MHQLVRTAFEELFRDLVCHYPDYEKYTFNSVGMGTGRIIEYPIDELANRMILEKAR